MAALGQNFDEKTTENLDRVGWSQDLPDADLFNTISICVWRCSK
jgi:hypothetical protein